MKLTEPSRKEKPSARGLSLRKGTRYSTSETRRANDRDGNIPRSRFSLPEVKKPRTSVPGKSPVGGISPVFLGFRLAKCAHRQVVTKIHVPRHHLGISGGPDSSRRRARDLGIDHDTFHDRKSMHESKSKGIKDETREEKHGGQGVEKRGAQGFVMRTT